MRGLVLAVAQQPQIKALLTTGAGRGLARRFVAGERLEDALRVTARLRAAGAEVSLDFLGEAVSSMAEAENAAAVYRETTAALHSAGLVASLSIKATQFGVAIDFGRCVALVADLATRAATLPATVRLDMESSAYTDLTLRLWRALREQHPNVGIVLQASLHRTGDDLARAINEGASIRLCKGAYAEPPQVAFAKKGDVDANYGRLMRQLLEGAAALPPMAGGNEPRAAIATHDERLIGIARRVARGLMLGPERYEFQMLYGVRRDLQSRLIAAGEPVRIYVPWGPAWYPYLSRRLAERPANIVFIGRALLTELMAGHHNGR